MSTKIIVRLTTDYYSHGDSFVFSKKLRCMKRLSVGSLNSFGCDVSELFEDIINLSDCPDGLYELKMVNISHDIESGYADDWDLVLIPYDN